MGDFVVEIMGWMFIAMASVIAALFLWLQSSTTHRKSDGVIDWLVNGGFIFLLGYGVVAFLFAIGAALLPT